MTTAADIDLGLDYDDLIAEEKEEEDSRWRRKDRHAPLIFEGDWDGTVTMGSETYNNGSENPRWVFMFKNVKFTKLSPSDLGMFTDGQDYALMMFPLDKSKKEALQQFGKCKKATGKNINAENFKGRVRVTEITENYMKNGYHEQSYHWKFERISASNGAKPAAEPIPADLIEEVLTFIDTYGEAGVNHLALAPAIMQNQALNKNKSLNDQIMAGKLLELLGTRVTVVDGVVKLSK